MAQQVRTRSTYDGNSRDKSIPELMRELADETATLVHQELDLAKTEMTEKAREIGVGAGMFGAAGLFLPSDASPSASLQPSLWRYRCGSLR